MRSGPPGAGWRGLVTIATARDPAQGSGAAAPARAVSAMATVIALAIDRARAMRRAAVETPLLSAAIVSIEQA
jgi:hypothetical protein